MVKNCLECGEPIPRGRHYTCSYRCKANRNNRLNENLQRRQSVDPRSNKSVLDKIMGMIFQ